MTAPYTPQPANHPRPLQQATPYIVLYALLAAIPLGLWYAAGNPIAATVPYLNLDQAELFWNTLRDDPAADAPDFALALIDLAWIAWTPFALAAVLQLLITAFRIPHAVIPRILLRLTPTTVVSLVVTGTATIAQAHTGAIHAATAQHHGHDRADEHGHHGRPSRRSILETQILRTISNHDDRHRQHLHGTRTVQPGDTLWTIAEDTYGQGQDWTEIYKANCGHIEQGGEALTNPDLIKRGWTLNLPDDAHATQPHATGPTPAPRHPTADVGGPHEPGATASGTTSAATGRIAPTTPIPATAGPTGRGAALSAPHRPVPPTTATARDRVHHTPHAHGRQREGGPWTTAVELPDGGYIGISLLMATVGATLTLRRRARRTRQGPDAPQSVKDLAVIAARAEMAAAGEWDPECETDPTPPPLLRPRPEHLIFGTVPTGADEAILDPAHHPLTVYTGPGAHEAAAALALSALASQPPHRLVLTKALAHQLLGTDTEPDDPAWLTLTPDAPAALNATAAHGNEDTSDTRTLVIADAQSASTFQISAALAADKQCNRLAILLIGDPSHLAAHTPTTITIDDDGRPTKTTGPQAAVFVGTRFHTLPRTTAADLYTTLRHDHAARTVHRIPTQARGEYQAPLAGQHPEPDPADDEHHQASAPPAPASEAETPQQQAVPSTAASKATAPTATPSHAPILLRILGPLILENTTGRTRLGSGGRNAQLLTYLAIHPRGRTLHQITADIWNTDNPAGANRTLVRLRQELHAALTDLAADPASDLTSHAGAHRQPVIREPHGTYHLNHRLIRTDYTDFTRLEAEARTEKDPTRRAELATQALAHVRGDIAEGVPDLDQGWLAAERADLDDRANSLETTTHESALKSTRPAHGISAAMRS